MHISHFSSNVVLVAVELVEINKNECSSIGINFIGHNCNKFGSWLIDGWRIIHSTLSTSLTVSDFHVFLIRPVIGGQTLWLSTRVSTVRWGHIIAVHREIIQCIVLQTTFLNILWMYDSSTCMLTECYHKINEWTLKTSSACSLFYSLYNC